MVVYNINTLGSKGITKHESRGDSEEREKASSTGAGGLRYDGEPLSFYELPYTRCVGPDEAMRELIPVPYPGSTRTEFDLVILLRKLHISRGVETGND